MSQVDFTKPTYPAVECLSCHQFKTVQLRQGIGWCYGCKSEFHSQALFPEPSISDLNEAMRANDAYLAWYEHWNNDGNREAAVVDAEAKIKFQQDFISRISLAPMMYDQVCSAHERVNNVLINRKRELLDLSLERARIMRGQVVRQSKPKQLDESKIKLMIDKTGLSREDVLEVLGL